MPTRKVKTSERRRCAKACQVCKRRKERCDGYQPCGRCVQRSVGDRCTFISSPSALCLPSEAPVNSTLELSIDVHELNALSPDPTSYRLIPDGQGKFTFIGDAANLSLLQTIRTLVNQSLGPCDFTNDPFRNLMVETGYTNQQNWIIKTAQNPPAVPGLADTAYLLWWYTWATNCVFNLFDETELRQKLIQWQQQTTPDRLEEEPMSAIFFLIFAIGAQTCPENRDEDAERYFRYGRLLMTISNRMDDPNISTVTANVLVTMYLLGGSRRNAAFTTLGTAVRAAYALGLHRRDINELFESSQFILRERLWKILRVLDLFMSASLGRPPSTCETRDTKAESNYSASIDLCAIFETILTKVYSNSTVTPETLARISEHHRQWAQKFATGLAVDDIKPEEFIHTNQGKSVPNVGLLHLKEAYYWTIMLLTRPFLVERATSQSTRGMSLDGDMTPEPPSNRILAHACVDSAIRTVDLLSSLTAAHEVPKRLPFVVNSLFVAALVLGLAYFGDLDQTFPVGKSLSGARQLLSMLGKHDAIAKRDSEVVENLQAACDLYLEKRALRKMEMNGQRIEVLFGVVHGNHIPQTTSLREDNCQIAPYGNTTLVDSELAPRTDASENNGMDFVNSPGSAFPKNHAISIGLGEESFDMMLPDFATMTDLSIPVSPSTFSFDTMDGNNPLFSTIDASLLLCEDNGLLFNNFML